MADLIGPGSNQRFMQPGYNAIQHETRLAATQDMPLSWAVIRDPLTETTGARTGRPSAEGV